MKIKTVAVLTSGGDAPGMNTALFGIYSICKSKKIKLYAVESGLDGLIDDKFSLLDFAKLEGKLNRGGSAIKSSRSSRFIKSTYFNQAVANIKKHNIDLLVIIGGNGSTHASIKLRNAGISVSVIPATIDNDMNFQYCLGFDSATNHIVNAIDDINDSLSSFGYGTVISIMGRECADLIDSVATAIHTKYVLKDKGYPIANLIKQIKEDKKELPIVVLVLENTFDCVELTKILQEKCKFQWRTHILGYLQRGGSPSAYDRRYAYSAGITCIESALLGKYNLSFGMDNDKITAKTLEESLGK